MTDQEINVAIAEACGFERWKSNGGVVTLVRPTDRQREYWSKCGEGITNEYPTHFRDVPNYTTDTNAALSAALHAAQNVCDADQWEEFGRLLYEEDKASVIANSDGTHDFHALGSFVAQLNAKTICICLLKSIGKWRE